MAIYYECVVFKTTLLSFISLVVNHHKRKVIKKTLTWVLYLLPINTCTITKQNIFPNNFRIKHPYVVHMA